ncbi:hypothetical protein COY27_07005 [Candidatus Woesearchaeota archaeon CG_4_10_14_0_2_um_filter_33_13]|nr:MAG: hypothetical protein COY27_07005 [Candidatus Woesearchaeota archaeon CG_4_10_14_0_2_um_filter_33_13]
MPTLIACVSTGKGTWTEVNKIIASPQWDKVFLITNKFGQENFNPGKAQFVLIDNFAEIILMVEQIKKQLNGKIFDFEVALNLASGSGNEHMAVLESVLELGLNFRLVTINKEGKMISLGLERN